MRVEELTKAQRAIVEAVRNYPVQPGKKRKWRDIAEKHPEWRDHFYFPGDPKTPTKAYQTIQILIKRGVLNKHGNMRDPKPTEPQAQPILGVQCREEPAANGHTNMTVVEVRAVAHQLIDAVIQDNRLCPRCGRDIGEHMRLTLLKLKQ